MPTPYSKQGLECLEIKENSFCSPNILHGSIFQIYYRRIDNKKRFSTHKLTTIKVNDTP